jgi:hypothetical protein
VNAFTDARTELAGKLAAAGVTVSIDPRAVPPYVLVDVPTITAGQGRGGWSATIPIRVVAAPPGTAAALEWLLDQTELVLRTLLTARDAVPGTVDAAGKDCPAYTITVPVQIPNPDC